MLLGENGNGGLVDAFNKEVKAVSALTTAFTPLINKIDELISKYETMAEKAAKEIANNAEGPNNSLDLKNGFDKNIDYGL
jgi:hypothetical protein